MRSASRKPDASVQWYRDQHRFNGVLDAQIAATEGLNEAERIMKIDAALRRTLKRKSLRDFGTWARWFAISERLRRNNWENRRAPARPAAEAATGPTRPAAPAAKPPPDAMPLAPRPRPAQGAPAPAPVELRRDAPAPDEAPEKQTRVVTRKAPKPTRGRSLNSRLGRARSGKRKIG